MFNAKSRGNFFNTYYASIGEQFIWGPGKRLATSLSEVITGVWPVLVIVMVALMGHSNAHAFDDDRGISSIELKPESFLDVNAHSFRRSKDLEWLSVKNGMRMAGGSISTNRLFLDSELRMQSEISEHLSVNINFEQDEFYTNKPLTRPEISVDYYPLQDLDIGISILATAAHDKRQADLGYALTWGRLPNNFIRFSWLKVDNFYNDKNDFDDSFYEEFAEIVELKGVKSLTDKWLVQFTLKQSSPLVFISDSETSRFEHESHDYEVATYYHYAGDAFVGTKWRYFEIEKSLSETDSDRLQEIAYYSGDAFWVKNYDEYELTLGARYDLIDEDLVDKMVTEDSFDFSLETAQVYASLYHEYTVHQAWDFGLYAGHSDRERIYNGGDEDEIRSEMESKFRGSWQYQSADKKSALRFSLTLNLDNLISDPGDGGGIYYRTEF